MVKGSDKRRCCPGSIVSMNFVTSIPIQDLRSTCPPPYISLRWHRAMRPLDIRWIRCCCFAPIDSKEIREEWEGKNGDIPTQQRGREVTR